MDILIRKAKEFDARGIVEVLAYTWLTTYKGLIPNEILEKRVQTIDNRVQKTAESIKERDNTYVAIHNGKVIGEMTYAKSRNDEYPECGEIISIYVLKEYQGIGLGKKLFMTGIKELINSGFNSMILNVLDGNNTIKFYEKYSGKKVGEKEEKLGEITLKENVMLFDNLKDIYLKFNV